MEYKSEAHLQSICTKEFNRIYPNQCERLILIYNNPPNARMGTILKSMGLRKGASDQLYFPLIKFRLLWLEYKLGNGTQTDDQRRFQAMVEALGFEYRIIRSLEQFLAEIKSYN